MNGLPDKYQSNGILEDFYDAVSVVGLTADDFDNPCELLQCYASGDVDALALFLKQYMHEDNDDNQWDLFVLFNAIAIESLALDSSDTDNQDGKNLEYQLKCLKAMGEHCTQFNIQLKAKRISYTLASINSHTFGIPIETGADNQWLHDISSKRDDLVYYGYNNNQGNGQFWDSHHNFSLFMLVFIDAFKLQDVNAKVDDDGNTLLMHMVNNGVGRFLTVHNLINLGADPDIRNNAGMKALHCIDLSHENAAEAVDAFCDFDNLGRYKADPHELVDYVKKYNVFHDKSESMVEFEIHCSCFADEIKQYEKNADKVGLMFDRDFYNFLDTGKNNLESVAVLSEPGTQSNMTDDRRSSHL